MKLHPIAASRDFFAKLLHSAVRAERQRAVIEVQRRVRPLALFAFLEALLALLTLRSASSRKSWLSFLLAVALSFAAFGHAFLDIRDQKILDFLSQKLSD